MSFFVISIISLIIIFPNLCINSIYNGLKVWATCVFPSLFPFMFFTKILTDLNTISILTNKLEKLTKILFNAPAISSYIFLMSIISGYPVGAKLISDYYSLGLLTQKQANKLTTFCSTSGPLFIIGSVGTSLFLNKAIGYIMFLSHVLASIINGILYRNLYIDSDTSSNKSLSNKEKELSSLLPDAMNNSILSIMVVGGYIAIFFLLIDLLNNFNLLLPLNYLIKWVLSFANISLETASAISSGIIEISKGAVMLSTLNLSTPLLASLASFIIGFGGISVYFQANTFLLKCKINQKFYITQKITHGIISALLTYILCIILL